MSELALLEREDWVKQAKDKEGDYDLLRKGVATKVRKIDEENRSFEIVISSEAEDRDKDIIMLSGWQLKDFRKNPVVQWAHSHSMPAIARSLKTSVDDAFLIGEPKFPTEGVHPFADMVFNLYKEKIINASSVGFLPVKFEPVDPEDDSWFAPIKFLKQILLEFSLVNVPSNPEALGRAKSLGISITPLRDWAMKVLDGEAGEGGLWLPKSKIERALQIVENDKTAIAMDGYKLVPATKDSEAVVIIEVPIPKDFELSASDLDKRLSEDVIGETVTMITDAIMEEPVEEIIAASTDDKGAVESITMHQIECGHCELGVHSNITIQRLHKDKDDFWGSCPETNKPIILSVSDIFKTSVPVVPKEEIDEKTPKVPKAEEEPTETKTDVKDGGEATFETASGEQLLDAVLGTEKKEEIPAIEPDDFVKGVGSIIKDVIGQSTREAVREHITSRTGKLD